MQTLYEISTLLGQRLVQKNAVLSVAESCTGGLLAGAITAIAGSSQWFDRAFITYSNHAKIHMLQVNEKTLARYGAVSEAVAEEMARGVLQATTLSHYALSTTGIAGPGGASEEKPVGMVCFALAIRKEKEVEAYTSTQYFKGNRQQIRNQAVLFAMQYLLNEMR